jgi:S1-C subfamily serine protease
MLRYRLLIAAVLPALFGAGVVSRSADEPKAQERRTPTGKLLEKVRPAVVVLRGVEKDEKERTVWVGLGVLVDPQGTIVTPRRRLGGAGTVEVLLSDGRTLTAKVLSADPKSDVAVLAVKSDRPLPHAEFGDSDKLQVGDRVLSLDKRFRLTPEFGAEAGLYTGKRRATEKDPELLVMDSVQSIPPDRDLLFDHEGKLLGIWTTTGAVPDNQVKERVRQARERK